MQHSLNRQWWNGRLRHAISFARALVAACCLSACGTSQSTNSVDGQTDAIAEAPVQYDQDSWQKVIPEDCLHFTDGCNQCSRSAEGGVAACTRKTCFHYEMPRCLDETEAKKPDNFRKLHYSCEGGAELWVFYDEYRSGDSRVKLTSEQVYLSDSSVNTAYLLTRTPSASGEKYTNGKVTYFAKAGEAMVMAGGAKRHQGCKLTD